MIAKRRHRDGYCRQSKFIFVHSKALHGCSTSSYETKIAKERPGKDSTLKTVETCSFIDLDGVGVRFRLGAVPHMALA